ncbi:hypothetical protein BJ322DRAFT_1024522 [Thelephora terrestris]|uniref:Uncharacterized protein n=1 Tax=Thelephora terrestris TaxID=56493 RepID=A0A9P6H7B0_9AGAM|nr:hypothetical protein BJ322DRAFT_1024522 [Thelephora terrestris]
MANGWGRYWRYWTDATDPAVAIAKHNDKHLWGAADLWMTNDHQPLILVGKIWSMRLQKHFIIKISKQSNSLTLSYEKERHGLKSESLENCWLTTIDLASKVSADAKLAFSRDTPSGIFYTIPCAHLIWRRVNRWPAAKNSMSLSPNISQKQEIGTLEQTEHPSKCGDCPNAPEPVRTEALHRLATKCGVLSSITIDELGTPSNPHVLEDKDTEMMGLEDTTVEELEAEFDHLQASDERLEQHVVPPPQTNSTV